MTDTERPDDGHAGLDAELRRLPQAIEPARDLWPGIAAQLEPRESRRSRLRPVWAWQAAAAVLLVAGSSLLTATLLDRSRGTGNIAGTAAAPTGAPVAAPQVRDVTSMPAAFGPGTRLDADYMAARRQLTTMLEARMASLPESTRAKLRINLAEMRRAADQINAALAEQPGDPLLQELLLMTYQDELAVLANVNQLTTALAGTAGPTAPDGKRMQL